MNITDSPIILRRPMADSCRYTRYRIGYFKLGGKSEEQLCSASHFKYDNQNKQ